MFRLVLELPTLHNNIASPGLKSNVILSRISIALLRSKCCSAELPLRVELICTVCMDAQIPHKSTQCNELCPECGNSIKIHQWNNVQFLPGTATYSTNLY